MNISVPLENGYLPDEFGKYSDAALRRCGNCVTSFPIRIEGVPTEAETLALAFIDYDSTPVCGFTWIHWIACNIDPSINEIPKNASREGFQFIQGSNSCVSRADETDADVIAGYIGPCPPDKDHTYTLTVYALDCSLDLPEGFFANELHWAMKDHVIAQSSIDILSRA